MTCVSYNRFWLFLFCAGLSIGLFSCDNDDDGADLVDEPNTVAVEIQEDSDFSLLSAALEKANLFEVLDDDSSYTLLAPPDAAFIAAGITDLDDYTPEALAEILQYHVIAGEVLFAELEPGTITTLGGPVNLSVFSNRYFLNGDAEFIQINFAATNGIIHIIDEVLLPPEESVGSIISSEEELSTLMSALERTGLSSTLADGGPYTVFAPTNAAFELLLEELEISSLDEVPTDQLTRILQYHVVAGQTFSTELEAGSINTLLDEDFTVAFSNAILLADDVNGNDNAVVVAGNLLGTNGVVHVIDRVLRPE